MDAHRPTVAQSQSATSAPAKPQRDGFTTGFGVLAATLGSAVGLGNIWKFPFLTGVNGGATFILVYLVSTVVVGLPIMIAEIALGRRAKADAITTLRRLAPGRLPWWLVGAMGVLSAFLILAFYTEVAGWVFAYIFKAGAGALRASDPASTAQVFDALVADPVAALVWQWVVLAVVGTIVVAGVAKGIESTTKRLMPVLFGLLVLIGLRSLTLPGAAEGLTFLFRPDFSKLNGTMVLTAMGLAFFKLSIGMGTMITYGSYFRDDQDIPATATRVMLADLTVSLLAGIAIFPAVFAFGFKPDAGPALLFITIPAVFAAMPFGQLCMTLFFVLAAIAATGAMLSLLEVPVAFLHERLGLRRVTATLLTVGLLALIGSTAALSNSLLANLTVAGMTPFDLFDFATSNVLLPLGGLLLCLFVGWSWGDDAFMGSLAVGSAPRRAGVHKACFVAIKFLTPVLVLLVLLNGLKLL